MKTSDGARNRRGLIIICVALFTFASLPLLSSARSASTSVIIVNNSNREIRNVYLSHVDVDDWGSDQLSDGATIAPGQSFTLNNVACDQQQVKVIAEDQDGCFLSTVVNCGNSGTWTITDATARDCGGN
ncbi:MAG: hypothetical protein M3R69_17750 [Acidobacteriota bacterium]|nr:hypothetical protein [Acidobacteriota bacterium]